MKENRLAEERSPYLRQHRTNPVDWYPWGEEALKRARDENRLIFLSIGYAACHWCHVMEHESFEDEATAKVLNDTFVCIKVDREERPDLDRVYMNAVNLFGRGGWPMTVLLTPDTRPVWGATYIPRERLKAWAQRVGDLWAKEPDKILQQAEAVTEQAGRAGGNPDVPATDDSDAEILKTMRNALGASFDSRHGGYGTRPKFPPHTELLYFLDVDGRRAGESERAQILRTLDAMEEGGIHDHVGGGFHRYSTDERWLLPHFEKMLYDNALLAQAYAGAFALTGKTRYRRVVERLFGWLEREMARPGGGYASSLDADTQGEEGLTYTWTVEELRAALGDDAGLAIEILGVEERGNFAEEAGGHRTGRSILYLPRPLERVAADRKVEPGDLQVRLDGILERLQAVRAKRAQPGLDDKVITGWNGLLVSGYARAGVDLNAPEYLDRARTLAGFLLGTCRREDGTLLRFPAGSGPEIPAFCEDYVHLIEGLLDLADATKESRWEEAARVLADRLVSEFQDEEAGGFWTSSRRQHDVLFARTKETWDSPIPSDNAAAARLNLRLFARTGDARYQRAADRTLTAFRPLMGHPRMTSGVMGLLRALTLRMELEAAGVTAPASGDVRRRADVALVDVFLERAEAAPGSRVGVIVRVRLDDGWHVNAHTPSRKELVATTLRAGAKGPALEGIEYPGAVQRKLGGDTLALYEGTFEIRARLVVPEGVPPGPRKVPLELTLQPCDESHCKAPVTLELEVPLRYADEDGPRQHASVFGKR